MEMQKKIFQKTRAVEQIANRLKVHYAIIKTKALARWKDVSRELSIL